MGYDVILLDAGTGNLSSVYNALHKLGYQVLLTDSVKDLDRKTRVILPGVGAFARFMDGLRERYLIDGILETRALGLPMLGICVGMQAMFEVGEEMGAFSGMGLLKGRVPLFKDLGELKIPHTGWNQIVHDGSCPLFREVPSGSYAYFNHSFYCQPAEREVIAAETNYGIRFTSVVRDGNLFGVQFHPEKSQRVGLQILKNFMSV
ncbi:MAG: imidazole glycerol phosphate synthase subunit HisH [Anaerolineaceae bacterium]|nr:imidazole glycerol phosphate synthase subunit HisH [Anaerolineaceae bacterium]